MRRVVLLALGLLLGCESDPADPAASCPECRPFERPVLGLLCGDGVPNDSLFAAHFGTLTLVDAGTGQPGYPDESLGARFSRKAALELRGEIRAPLEVLVCVRSRNTHQLVFNQLRQVAPPSVLVSLGSFARDHYVLHLKTDTRHLRSIAFASE